MNKKILISFLLVCVLLVSLIAIPACATNVDAIKPSGTTTIVGITGTETPIHGTLPTYNAGTAIVVIAPGNEYQQLLITEDGVQVHNMIELDDKEEEAATPEDTSEPTDTKEEEIVVPEDATMNEAIFLLTNKERQKEKLPLLKYNKDLQEAADIRAKECAQQFSHTRPDGTSCHTVVEKFDYTVTGENLIKADNPIATPDVLVDSWMKSQGHKDNILLYEYTSMAVGVYVDNGVTYAVQIFMG